MRIEPNVQISARLIPGNVYFSNGSIDTLQSQEFQKFTKTSLCSTTFRQIDDVVEIEESMEIENVTFFDRIKWIALGFFYKIFAPKTEKIIRAELDNLPTK